MHYKNAETYLNEEFRKPIKCYLRGVDKKTVKKVMIAEGRKSYPLQSKTNDFNVLGVREYNERTDYLIEKGGIKCEYPVYALDNKAKRGDNCYNLFNEYYDLKRKTNEN